MVAHRDKNHDLVIKAMKARMGGYERDTNGAHHANLKGLRVSAFDMHKAGSGFPDWLIFVSWFAVTVEIKNEETLKKKGKAGYETSQYLFASKFKGIRKVITEQNQLYDYLCEIATLVHDLEDLASSHASLSYIKAFFPKAIDFTNLLSEEMHNGSHAV